MRHLLPLALLALAACAPSKSTPVPTEVCAKLVAAGVAKNCRPEEPRALSALAKPDMTQFDLPSVPGHGGVVMSFNSVRDFNDTAEKERAAALLTGPHRYGNEKALIFVQFNDGASAAIGAKAKAVVDAL